MQRQHTKAEAKQQPKFEMLQAMMGKSSAGQAGVSAAFAGQFPQEMMQHMFPGGAGAGAVPMMQGGGMMGADGTMMHGGGMMMGSEDTSKHP